MICRSLCSDPDPASLTRVLVHVQAGTVSMAIAGDKDTNASQFFITCAPDLDYLDEKHTVFGEVSEGMDVVKAISEQMVDELFRPLVNIRIKHVTILDDPVPEKNYPKGTSHAVFGGATASSF
jgi:peptidyl-prolyl cis-trans isomerase-like 4